LDISPSQTPKELCRERTILWGWLRQRCAVAPALPQRCAQHQGL